MVVGAYSFDVAALGSLFAVPWQYCGHAYRIATMAGVMTAGLVAYVDMNIDTSTGTAGYTSFGYGLFVCVATTTAFAGWLHWRLHGATTYGIPVSVNRPLQARAMACAVGAWLACCALVAPLPFLDDIVHRRAYHHAARAAWSAFALQWGSELRAMAHTGDLHERAYLAVNATSRAHAFRAIGRIPPEGMS
jgi:hypothetical protein